MDRIVDIVQQMRTNHHGIRFNDLCIVRDYYFGTARQKGSSHRIYKTSWQENPRINIQNNKGKAKAYQVKQVLVAIEILGVTHETEK